MFKGIKKIKGLGVYGDYSPPAETAEFGIKNLIYGWNYSGKHNAAPRRLRFLIDGIAPPAMVAGTTDAPASPLGSAAFGATEG